MNKNIKSLLFIVFIIWLLVKCVGSCDDATTTYSDNYQEEDYSWVYGTWQMTIDGETHTICFLENGVYTEHFRGYYGSNSDSGTYTIQSGRIKCDCGDGYPSYIDIEGKRLTSNGEYYRKK